MRNRLLPIVLVSIIVILAGTVGFLLWRDSAAPVPAATTGVGGGLGAGAPGGATGPGSGVGIGVDSAANAVSVTAARVAEGAVGRTVRLTGNVAPARDVTLVSKVPGTVLWSAGEMGTRVEAGDPIVRLDDTELQLAFEQSSAQHMAAAAQLARLEAGAAPEEIAQVEAAVEQARLGLERVATVLTRQEQLFDQGIIAEETVLSVRTEHEVARLQYEAAQQQLTLIKRGATEQERNAARAQVQQAQVAVKLAEQQLADTVIRAPFAGLLAAQPIQTGTLIGGGTPVVGIVDIDKVVIEANVSEREINQLHVGQTVNVTVDALGGNKISAVIESVAPVADRQSRAFPVRFVADNADHRLKPGMVARVEVSVDAAGAAVGPVIPEGALFTRAGRSLVFTVDTDAVGRQFVRERQVQTGEVGGGFIAVRSGLAMGDIVVVNPSASLRDGSFVRMIGEDM